MRNLVFGLVLLVVGFSMGQMSANLVQVNPWALSLFVAGLGLALGYVSRQQPQTP
jgi:hypothetical protein